MSAYPRAELAQFQRLVTTLGRLQHDLAILRALNPEAAPGLPTEQTVWQWQEQLSINHGKTGSRS